MVNLLLLAMGTELLRLRAINMSSSVNTDNGGHLIVFYTNSYRRNRFESDVYTSFMTSLSKRIIKTECDKVYSIVFESASD